MMPPCWPICAGRARTCAAVGRWTPFSGRAEQEMQEDPDRLLTWLRGRQSRLKRWLGLTPMTEAEWLAYTNPHHLLRFLRRLGMVSDRKLRLYCVACCHRLEEWMTDERTRSAVEVAERYAEGLAGERDLAEGHRSALAVYHPFPVQRAAVWATSKGAMEAAVNMHDAVTDCLDPESARRETAREAALIRDIFGKPFAQTPAFDAAWRTPSVLALATRAYDERAFDGLPELATALEEAGCDNACLLAHPRGAGPHVRGCWALDLVLGKK